MLKECNKQQQQQASLNLSALNTQIQAYEQERTLNLPKLTHYEQELQTTKQVLLNRTKELEDALNRTVVLDQDLGRTKHSLANAKI